MHYPVLEYQQSKKFKPRKDAQFHGKINWNKGQYLFLKMAPFLTSARGDTL
jgi:hypothetical protein